MFDQQPQPVRLEIRGLFTIQTKHKGQRVTKRVTIPSFKNAKMVITKSPYGQLLKRPLVITKPEYQTVMQMMVDSFVSQLRSVFQTTTGQTLAGSSIRSWIALSMPLDDCWEKIPEIKIKCELCEPGNEGATITVERL